MILVVETVVLVLLTVLVAGLLRSHAEILRRLHALGAGLDPDAAGCGGRRVRSTCAPMRRDVVRRPRLDLDGAGLRDDAMHVSVVGARHRTLLAFLSSGCLDVPAGSGRRSPTRAALDLPDDIRLVVVTKDASRGEHLGAAQGSRLPTSRW